MAEKWSERHPDEALRLQAEANRGWNTRHQHEGVGKEPQQPDRGRGLDRDYGPLR